MRSKIAMVVAGVVIAGIAGWLVSWNGPRLEVVNETRVKQFGVSWWRWRMYAHNMGYTKQEAKKIRVVFTDKRQTGYELWSGYPHHPQRSSHNPPGSPSCACRANV